MTRIAGEPLLRRVVMTALATGAPVTVTLPLASAARRGALCDLDIVTVDVSDAAAGMSRSLAAGVASIADHATGAKDGLMVLPADMPGFTDTALQHLIARYYSDPDAIVRGASKDGSPGHPAIFPRDLWPELAAVTGDEGGRSVLKRHSERVSVILLPDDMAILDLDTPEDWAAYLSRQ